MKADFIIHEIRRQAFLLKAKDPSVSPKNFRVYLGREEIFEIGNIPGFEHDLREDKLTVMGMPSLKLSQMTYT